jgi:hypothetical protein
MGADAHGLAVLGAGQVHGREERAPQLADVERPRIAQRQAEGVEIEGDPLQGPGSRTQDRADEQAQVLAPLAQGEARAG